MNARSRPWSRASALLASATGLALMLAPLGAAPARGAVTFRMHEFGVFGSKSALARSINASGQVAGSFQPKEGWTHAFVMTGRKAIDLGPGDANAINDLGQVVGSRDVGGHLHAFLWDASGSHDLGTPPGGSASIAYDINNRGQVVGQWSGESTGVRPFLYDKTGMHDLGNLGGAYAAANAINDAGQIVGYSWTATELDHPFLYDETGMHDLAAEIGAAAGPVAVLPWGGHSVGGLNDINDAGSVLGSITASCVEDPRGGSWTCRSQPFVYSRNLGTFRLLAPLVPGDFVNANKLNDHEQVVGWARPPAAAGTGICHAVLWTADGVRDLGTIGPETASTFAYDISDDGTVTGGAGIGPGMLRVFMLDTE